MKKNLFIVIVFASSLIIMSSRSMEQSFVTTKQNSEFLNVQRDDKSTPLHIACRHIQPVPMIKFLIENGADVNAKDEVGFTPLHYAVLFSTKEVIETLILYGALVESADERGSTALIFSAQRNDATSVSICATILAALKASKEFKEQGITL